MESALIVSSTGKSAALFTELLKEASVKQITILNSAGEARRLLLEHDFDLVIVNSPLHDESGESFSRHIASKSLSQVILAVKSEQSSAAAAACEDDGVFTISKPVNKELFLSLLSFAKAADSKIKKIQGENEKLKLKIEDIKTIDRAKLLLISYLNLSEQESHRFIEKQAMDLRLSKRAIAEGILKTYAS